MHIGVVLDTEFTTDIRVLNEVTFLKDKGYKISVLCPNYKNYPSCEIFKDVTIHRFNFNKTLKNKLFGINNVFPVYDRIWINETKAFIDKVNVDVIHTHDLYMAKPVYFAAQKKKLPIVLDLHENYPEAVLSYEWANKGLMKYLAQPWKWRKKEKEYLSYASKLVVLSESFKKDLLYRFSFLKSENIFDYPNVPDVKKLQEFEIDPNILKKEPDDFILFYFGGISKRRGIFTCIKALEQLNNEHKNIKLLLIGPVDNAEQKEFNEAISRPSAKNNIIFYPWKDLKYLPSYIAISDVCLSPIVKNKQHESGVANKIFQYMLFERPLVVSNCGPQVEIVEGHNCGISFESENSNDLYHKILHLYSDRDLCKRMGQNGKVAVLNKYNLEKCGETLLNLYNSIG